MKFPEYAVINRYNAISLPTERVSKEITLFTGEGGLPQYLAWTIEASITYYAPGFLFSIQLPLPLDKKDVYVPGGTPSSGELRGFTGGQKVIFFNKQDFRVPLTFSGPQGTLRGFWPVDALGNP